MFTFLLFQTFFYLGGASNSISATTSLPPVKRMDSIVSNSKILPTTSFSISKSVESPKMLDSKPSFDEVLEKSNGVTSVRDWWMQQVDCHYSSDGED